MYAVTVLSSLKKSYSSKARTITSFLKYIQRKSYKTKQTSFSFKPRVENDVTLFHFEKPHFFIVINLFSATQCAFWTYLGLFLFQEIKKSTAGNKTEKLWLTIFQSDRKFGNLLCMISIVFGWSMFFITVIYSSRSIRKLILHKGGKNITIVTYNLPGYNTITVPLNNMSSFQHRIQAKKYIPIKIKNKYFYYLIDLRGKFSNPVLFDSTAGIKRSI